MTIRAIYAATLLSVVAATSAQGASLNATAATFQTVMARATGGDTVNLVGNFGVTKLTNKTFASLVTINASAATFSNTLLLQNVSNVTVVGGHFGSDTALTAYSKAVDVIGGANVSFTNPYVTGYYAGQGITFTGTRNATVTGATLTKLQAGIVLAGVTGGSISNSRSVGAVSDGFDIADSSFIDIGNNSCTGSTPMVGAHPDCVQMFSSTSAAAPLTHINIHNNSASGATQGFDTYGANNGSSFISIVNNRVDGLFSGGVACNYCVNSTITGNIITTLSGAPHQVTLSIIGGTGNLVSGNTVGAWNRAAAGTIPYYTRAQLIGHATVNVTAAGAVPEPAAWTMLIAGFAAVGLGQRTRRRYHLA